MKLILSKDISTSSKKTIETHIQKFETYLKRIDPKKENEVAHWIDVDEYVKFYWIQELSKNSDANFWASVYFTWIKDDVVKMGPVWDFDLAYGGSSNANISRPVEWRIRQAYWNNFLFKDSVFSNKVLTFFFHHAGSSLRLVGFL